MVFSSSIRYAFCELPLWIVKSSPWNFCRSQSRYPINETLPLICFLIMFTSCKIVPYLSMLCTYNIVFIDDHSYMEGDSKQRVSILAAYSYISAMSVYNCLCYRETEAEMALLAVPCLIDSVESLEKMLL